MGLFDDLTSKLSDKLLDAASRAQEKQIEERDGTPPAGGTSSAAPGVAPDAYALSDTLTPEEMVAFAQRRARAWRYYVIPSIGLMMLAVATFYFNPPPGIPYVLFAIGFGVWLYANRQVVCPRCDASLLGKAERERHCRKCGVRLR